MAEPLDRDTMIHLLNRLGSENDADVLEAARYLHERVAESGASWDELLVATFEGAREPEAEPPATKAPARPAGGDALALVETLLARSDISTELREELEGYKSDIAANEFGESDRRYLAALYERLS